MSVDPSPQQPMESPSSESALTPPVSDSATSRVKQFLLSHVRGAIVVSVSGAMVLFGASTWNIWQLYKGFQTTIAQEFRLQRLSDSIVYLDEVLTMSARMSASTSDPKWEKRYMDNVPQLDSALEEVAELVPTVAQSQTSQTDAANKKLIELEERAFELVNDGKADQAFKLLLSQEYQTQKDIYAEGIDKTIDIIAVKIDALQTQFTNQLKQSLLFAGLSIPLLLLSGSIVIWLIRTYLSDRLKAEGALRESEQSLLKVNLDLASKMEQLEEKSTEISAKEQATQEEASVLQEDIGHLLDVLSDLEMGDFTVKADVNDRITGLVSDTLNRLTEQLGQTLSEVVVTANTASKSSAEVKDDAENVAQDVEKQAQEVNEVLKLTDRVNDSANNAIQRVVQNNKYLKEAGQAIESGESAITNMNQSIEVLESGSDRMVQRVKTLGEFVSLADQFVQDQNQVAALTQVLALNASLVAAKAAEQNDPNKFHLVAREFETIANQVRNLAQQTNTGLESLQQRTTQIRGVVSEVDHEVQGLNGLVQKFGTGVDQTTQAFAEVKERTLDVQKSGQAVTQGNKDIIQAAQSTSNAMKDIFLRAGRTATRMQSTLESATQMKQISMQLLDAVQVFRLENQLDQSSIQDQTFSNDVTTAEPSASERPPEQTSSDAPNEMQLPTPDSAPAPQDVIPV